jgi:hypothetical protein
MLGERFACRFSCSTWRASFGRHQPSVTTAIIAVETCVRGSVWRWLEYSLARFLLALGRSHRVALMSLGPAQLRPARVAISPSIDGIAALVDPVGAQRHCSQLVLEITYDLGLDMTMPDTWTREEWRRFGKLYNGSFDYGDVLRATFSALVSRRRSVLLRDVEPPVDSESPAASISPVRVPRETYELRNA